MRVELHIGRLVLDESVVERHQTGAVTEALHAELSRLLNEAPDGSWQSSRRLRGVVAPAPVEAGGDPSALGRDIAGSVAASVSPTTPVQGGGRP